MGESAGRVLLAVWSEGERPLLIYLDVVLKIKLKYRDLPNSPVRFGAKQTAEIFVCLSSSLSLLSLPKGKTVPQWCPSSLAKRGTIAKSVLRVTC